MKKLIAILLPIIILAFPNAIETICIKTSNILMMIITPTLEFMARILS